MLFVEFNLRMTGKWSATSRISFHIPIPSVKKKRAAEGDVDSGKDLDAELTHVGNPVLRTQTDLVRIVRSNIFPG